MSIPDSNKKRGRGRPATGIGKSLGLRLYRKVEEEIDAWIKAHPEPRPSKPEAIRRLIELGLKRKRKRETAEAPSPK